MKQFLVIFAAILITAALSFYVITEQRRATGEIFITLNNLETLRLSGVEVLAVDGSEARERLRLIGENEAKAAAMQPDLDAAKAKLSATDIEFEQVTAKNDGESNRRYRELQQQRSNMMKDIAKIQSAIADLNDPLKAFQSAFKKVLASTTTSADGTFQIRVPRGCYLTAFASRTVPVLEVYCWLLPVESTHLLLTNRNELPSPSAVTGAK